MRWLIHKDKKYKASEALKNDRKVDIFLIHRVQYRLDLWNFMELYYSAKFCFCEYKKGSVCGIVCDFKSKAQFWSFYYK